MKQKNQFVREGKDGQKDADGRYYVDEDDWETD